ncbi:MAG: hypothetical protein ABIQ39_01095 [Ilumatobacteraceae bacterium]
MSSRKFCSRCGTTLTAATVVTISWWRRLLPHRRPKELRAGERPWEAKGSKARAKPKRHGLAKLIRPVRRILSIVVVVAGLAYGVYTPFRTKVNSTYTSAKDKVISVIHPKFDPVTAGPGTTSNIDPPIDPDHPGLMATDGFKNTYWLAPPPSPTVSPELDVTLTEKADLERIIVRNGASDNFQGYARPKSMRLVYDNGQQDDVQLKNTPDPQTLSIHHGGNVTRLRIVITDVYEAINVTQVALTEIEFFKKH